MRHVLTSLFLVVFLYPSLALGQGVTMDDLVRTNGLYYKKFTDVPFTGTTTGKIQGTFRNGEKDGPWVFYHYDGQLSEKGTFKDGEREGLWIEYHDYAEDGLLYFIGSYAEGTYKDGKKEGPWVEYYENGQIFSEGTYKDGRLDGRWVIYHYD
jgi:antitoxin component YwqK of YwqJK toxin-antitoxin module